MPGIWLTDDEVRNSAGAIWVQQQQQRVQAGQDWAGQQMARLQQQAAQQVAQLAPSPVAPPPVTAPPPAPTPVPTPAPTPPPAPVVPIGGTPVAAPTPPMPGDLNATGIAPPTATPQAPTVPTPAPAQTPSIAEVGQNWAQQQINNLLNPSTPSPSSTPTPPSPSMTPSPPSPASALPDQSQAQGGLTPAATPTPPVTPAPTPAPAQTPSPTAASTQPAAQASQFGPIDSSSPQAFAQSFAPYAQYAAQKLGVDPSWVTAMAASESNYGKAAAAGNELFGIKALPGQPGTSLATHEGEYGGTNMNQTFASYDTPLDAVNAYVNLLANHYQGSLGAQDLGTFVHGLKQGGYFTAAEDEYKGILQSIANRPDIQAGLQQGASTIDTAKQTAQNVLTTGQTAVNTAVQGAQAAVARTSQFAMGLSSGDAYAFCGPAAAMAFADTYGRNPTVAEAKQLAQQVGWNPDQGMAGVGSEVNLLKAMGVDAHATQGVDWAQVGRDASGGNPVVIDTPGHYYYVDGYNGQTGQLHVGTSGTDLKGGSEWMTPDQINQMPQSGGNARAAIFADHPLAQQDGLAQSTAAATKQPTVMGGLQDAAGNVLANAPLPFIGQSANQIGGLLSTNAQQVQQARDLLSSTLTPDPNAPAPLQAEAGDILQAVQTVGGQATQASQNLLQQGQQLLQTQPPQSIGDILNQNALTSSGIPNIGGKALEGAANALGQGQQALGGLNDVLSNPQQMYANSPTAAFNQNLQSLGQNVLGPALNPLFDALNPVRTPDTTPLGSLAGGLSQANVPLLSGAADVAQPLLKSPGVLDSLMAPQALAAKYGTTDSSQYSPEDQQKLADAETNARMAVGGLSTADVARTVQAGRIGSLAGGIPTMAHIALNFPVQVGLKLLQDVPTSALTGHPGAVGSELYGAYQGFRAWAMNAATALGGLAPTSAGEALQTGLKGLVSLHPIMQDLPAQMARSMDLYRTAYIEAKNVAAPGSAAFNAEVARLVSSPTADMTASATAAANTAGLKGPMGTIGEGMNTLLKNVPILKSVIPFLNVGYHLAAQGIEHSPLGAVGTAWDVARGVAGEGPYAGGNWAGRGANDAVTPLAERFRNNMIGTGLALEAYQQAALGNITGEGPDDPKQQQALRDMGWQPDSIRINGRYIDAHLLGPVGWGLIQGANAYEAANGPASPQGLTQGVTVPGAAQLPEWVPGSSQGDRGGGYLKPLETPEGLQQPGAGNVLADLVARQARYFNNETFLNGVGSVLNLIGSSHATGQVAPREVASVLQSLIPQGALLANVASAVDPSMRETRGATPQQTIQQAVQSRLPVGFGVLPGGRQALLPQLTATGAPVPNPQQGAGLLLPRSTPSNADPILMAMASVGVTPSAPPDKVPYGPYADVRLTPQEQQQWQQYRGQLLQQLAGPTVSSPSWSQAPDQATAQAQRRVLATLDSQASAVANRMLLGDITSGQGQSPRTPDQGQSRMIASGAMAPVYSYAPMGLSQQLFQQQQQAAQHRALMQSLLSQPAG